MGSQFVNLGNWSMVLLVIIAFAYWYKKITDIKGGSFLHTIVFQIVCVALATLFIDPFMLEMGIYGIIAFFCFKSFKGGPDDFLTFFFAGMFSMSLPIFVAIRVAIIANRMLYVPYAILIIIANLIILALVDARDLDDYKYMLSGKKNITSKDALKTLIQSVLTIGVAIGSNILFHLGNVSMGVIFATLTTVLIMRQFSKKI